MRMVHVDDLKTDMELARPIIDGGTYLLTAGCNDLPGYKEKLKQLGIEYVYIKDEFSLDIEVTKAVCDETRREGQEIVEEIFDEISSNGKPDLKKAKKYVRDLIEEIMAKDTIMLNLLDIKTTDSYTYSHSVSVAVLSLLIGKSLKLNQNQLEKLGMGALTHDVGKGKIPEDILKKPDSLTDKEYEVIQEHPRLGYERLKEEPEITSTSLAAVLGHHENYGGNGYPRGVSGDNIHLFPRIVAVADVFDALTSDRIYRPRWTVNKAADWITSQSNKKFDPEIVKHFMRHVTLYPNGTTVKLNDGSKAVVIKQNENYPKRPIIRLLEDSESEIDLTEKLDIVIEGETGSAQN